MTDTRPTDIPDRVALPSEARTAALAEQLFEFQNYIGNAQSRAAMQNYAREILQALATSTAMREALEGLRDAAEAVQDALDTIFEKADDDRDEGSYRRVYAELNDARAHLRAALAREQGGTA